MAAAERRPHDTLAVDVGAARPEARLLSPETPLLTTNPVDLDHMFRHLWNKQGSPGSNLQNRPSAPRERKVDPMKQLRFGSDRLSVRLNFNKPGEVRTAVRPARLHHAVHINY
jgi:hypothetical protein